MKAIIQITASVLALQHFVGAELVVLQNDPKWCIGAKEIIQGAKLKLFECNVNSPLQNWKAVPSSLGGLTWMIGDNLCVEATQLDQDTKKQPRLDFCITSKKQRWLPDYGRDATQSIQSAKAAEQCVAYSGGTPESGRNIKLLTCNNGGPLLESTGVATKQAWLWIEADMYASYINQVKMNINRPEGIADLMITPMVPCPRDAKRCEDGTTIVIRDSTNSCEFENCPEDRNSGESPSASCTKDVRMCDADGSFIVRDPENNCQFPKCPTVKGNTNNVAVTPEEVRIQRAVWDGQFADGWPRDYSFDYTVECFCMRDWTRKRRVKVVDGEIESVVFADTLQAVSENIRSNTPTIEAFMGEISTLSEKMAMQSGTGKGKLDVVWDPQYGYPMSFSEDRSEMIADDEQMITIENVQIM